MDAVLLPGGLVCLVAALVLIMRAYRLPPAPGRCPACGYDLSGLPAADQCPECGDTADSRQSARVVRPGFGAVLKIPIILLFVAQSLLLVVVAIGSRNADWFGACLILTPFPHLALAFIVWALRRRLTPRAAATLMACGLLGVTPALTVACILFIPAPRDAFAAVALGFASALTMLPMTVGLLIGALIIQIRWYKQWPTQPKAPSAGGLD